MSQWLWWLFEPFTKSQEDFTPLDTAKWLILQVIFVALAFAGYGIYKLINKKLKAKHIEKE